MPVVDARFRGPLVLLLAGVSCAASAEQRSTPLAQSSEPTRTIESAPTNTTEPVLVSPPELSPAEAAEAATLAARCGTGVSRGPTYKLSLTEAPAFDDVVGPIRLEVADDVDFGRLAGFMQGFVQYGAGAALVARDGSTEGALLLLLESDYMKAPLVDTKACAPTQGVWQLHVRGRSVRLRAQGADDTWRDVSKLDQRAAEMRSHGVPHLITLNATASTPVSLAALALATVACAAEVEGEMPPFLELGEQCEDGARPSAGHRLN